MPGTDENGMHGLWYAITSNKVTFDSDDDTVIQTVLQIEGLDRAVRIAKTGFVSGTDGWNASGVIDTTVKYAFPATIQTSPCTVVL